MHWTARLIVVLLSLKLAIISPSPEEHALAQIIEGEADCEFMYGDSTGAYAVGWVARNRLESGQYGSSYVEIQNGFNGTISGNPQLRYLAIAHMVVNDEDDPTDGALYVFSQQDVDRLEFSEDEATLVIRASEHRALLFFAEWPGE